MADTPTTFLQVGLLVLFVLPGVVYRNMRRRLRGAVPGEQDFKMFLLRSMLATLVLNILYLAVGWPVPQELILPVKGVWFATALADLQRTAQALLLAVVVVPTALAWAQHGLSLIRERPARRFGPPTSWDYAFRNRRRAAFVRIRLKSGSWVGGWYNNDSYAAEYPHPPDLFLTKAYEMNPDGSFGPPVRHSGGLYVRMEDAELLEFVEHVREKPADE
ncbi:DUF6338 family protein [Nonomuraea maritima]|uniref:DUF6338 family protein n=1 Tax=Nonomuraea maritima TaxID=683260 RepID=UPI003717213C